MRSTISLLLTLLLLPLAIHGQPEDAASNGHFDDWPASAVNWGTDERSFVGVMRQGFDSGLVVFTAGSEGFGWRRAYSNGRDSFIPWADVAAWCETPGTVLFRTGEARRANGVHELEPEDRAVIARDYFGTYAAAAELSGDEAACSYEGLRVPRPSDRDRIIELLQAAEAAQAAETNEDSAAAE